MVQPYKPLYTVQEAADILLVNRHFVMSEIRAERLIALKLGRWKIRGTDLEKYIEEYPNDKPSAEETVSA